MFFLIIKKHGKSSKIKKNLDYLGVFIDILLVLDTATPQSMARPNSHMPR